jgi:transcriptional regulator with XRE-family HTH domain
MPRSLSIKPRGKPVADKIRLLAASRRLSRAEAAALMGVSVSTLMAWLKPSRYDAPERALDLLRLRLGVAEDETPNPDGDDDDGRDLHPQP